MITPRPMEASLVALVLAAHSLTCHSQEDGAFKSDRTSLGSRCTVGVGALVHYGVRIDDDVQITADSFVMKGEEVPECSRWSGNPARPASTDRALPSGSRVQGDLR